MYHNLSRAQARKGRDVQVVARRSAGQPAYEEVDGVHVHRVKTPYNVNALIRVIHLANEGFPTVIHSHSTSGVFLAMSHRAMSTPVVSHVHGTTISAATPMVLRFGRQTYGYSPMRVASSYIRERALWRSADRIAAVSSSVVSDLTTRYGIRENKIRLIYNGVDPDLFKPGTYPEVPEMPALEGKRVILYVGHFGLRKGIPILIEAMKWVAEEVKDAVLLCVGGVPNWLPRGEYLDYLKRLASTNEVDGKIMFLGSLSQQRLPAYYCLSSVFVLPSYYEAFPKVLVEAMACEKPVISSKMGGTSDSVEDGVNGFLVPFGDSKGLANALITLLQDEALSRKMGRLGRERVLRDFSWSAVANRLDSIYSEVICK
ncbi:MAG TPA: glycosyltransferase family 4 protein [Nitrososphaerales archaeon]|nr:glycosyltransferase family 4 protein [Nitrososphaerales archaeon]